MRILLVAGSYPPETGGIARFMKSFVDGLQSTGVDVEVISQLAMPQGYLRRVKLCRDSVIRHARLKAFDRVVVSSWSPFAVALPSQAAGRPLPFDVFCHGMDILEPSQSIRYRYLMRRTMKRASRILANSRYTASLAAALGAPENRLTVLHPAVDASYFTPGGQAAGFPILLSVGRLVERKGHDTVIRALPQILTRFPSLKYVCVGDGPAAVRLRALAQSLGVASNIEWMGELSESGLLRCYRSATVFAMPSRILPAGGSVEGFGIVFLEASSCEIPVIGGNSGGISDAVVDGETGYLVEPGNVEESAARIITLLSNPELRTRMGKAGRKRVVEQFTEDTLARRYLAVVSP